MAIRHKFISYRRGVSGASAAFNGWVEGYNRGIGVLDGSVGRPVRSSSGQIEVSRSGDFLIGDILVDQSSSRLFMVIQIVEQPSVKRLLVSEIKFPIPDEFESGIVESFWTVIGTWEMNVEAGELGSLSDILGVAGYQSTSILAIPFVYQVVSGDFDVYAKLFINAGFGAAQKHSLLKAALADDSEAVGVGIRANMKYLTFFRQDVEPGLSTVDAEKVPLAQYCWVRLSRVGVRFGAYFSTLSERRRPVRDDDWIEIVSTSGWTSSADVRLGIGFFNDSTTKVERSRFSFFRNWQNFDVRG